LFHKIALTCKSVRESLPNSNLLDQIRVITIKAATEVYHEDLPVKSFRYALALADVIQIQANAAFLKHARVMNNIIQLASFDPLKTP
jgi:hypothetical protein